MARPCPAASIDKYLCAEPDYRPIVRGARQPGENFAVTGLVDGSFHRASDAFPGPSGAATRPSRCCARRARTIKPESRIHYAKGVRVCYCPASPASPTTRRVQRGHGQAQSSLLDVRPDEPHLCQRASRQPAILRGGGRAARIAAVVPAARLHTPARRRLQAADAEPNNSSDRLAPTC